MSDSDSDDDDILLADTGMGGSSSKTLPAPASPLANVDMEALFGDLPELAKMRSSKAVSAFQPDEELLARDFGKERKARFEALEQEEKAMGDESAVSHAVKIFHPKPEMRRRAPIPENAHPEKLLEALKVANGNDDQLHELLSSHLIVSWLKARKEPLPPWLVQWLTEIVIWHPNSFIVEEALGNIEALVRMYGNEGAAGGSVMNQKLIDSVFQAAGASWVCPAKEEQEKEGEYDGVNFISNNFPAFLRLIHVFLDGGWHSVRTCYLPILSCFLCCTWADTTIQERATTPVRMALKSALDAIPPELWEADETFGKMVSMLVSPQDHLGLRGKDGEDPMLVAMFVRSLPLTSLRACELVCALCHEMLLNRLLVGTSYAEQRAVSPRAARHQQAKAALDALKDIGAREDSEMELCAYAVLAFVHRLVHVSAQLSGNRLERNTYQELLDASNRPGVKKCFKYKLHAAAQNGSSLLQLMQAEWSHRGNKNAPRQTTLGFGKKSATAKSRNKE